MLNPLSTTTICAPATAQGSALHIIRISGPEAFAAVGAITGKDLSVWAAGTVRFARIRKAGEVVDEVMVSKFNAPASYTGEDLCEITCHGSSYIVGEIIALLLDNGCCLAQPGEFTRRAFLNGKLDLSQAEAVADLIAAQNQTAHHAAISQLRGQVSTELARLRNELLHLKSLLELELDFSDHEDLEFADRTTLLHLSTALHDNITALARSFRIGQAIKAGIPVAIIGKTNVGKSTLLNKLLREERAIVSDIHGTTRDTIEDVLTIRGTAFRLIDTAGLRATTDTVEQIGIRRTHEAIEKADIVLWLFDTNPSNEETIEMQRLCTGKHLISIQTKIDIHPPLPSAAIHLSAHTGEGVDSLEQMLADYAASLLAQNQTIITSARHEEALLRALSPLQQLIDGLNMGLSGDLLAEHLNETLNILGEITGGTITSAETLNNIFSHFCVGK